MRLLPALLFLTSAAHADATIPAESPAQACAREMRVRLDNPDTVRCFLGHFPDEAWVVVWTEKDSGGVALFDVAHRRLRDRREWPQDVVTLGVPTLADFNGDGSDEIVLLVWSKPPGKDRAANLVFWDVKAGSEHTIGYPK